MSARPPMRPNDDLPPIEMYHQRKRVTPLTAKMRFDAARMAGERFIITRPTRPSDAFREGVSAGVVALLARDLPYKLGLMLAAIAGVATGMLTEAWFGKADATAQEEAQP